MELRLEAAEGCKMPVGSFVAVKLGDALKQGRYEPMRAYSFPNVQKRRHAKIDVFKHVGTSAVLVNPDAGNYVSEISITSSDPSVGNLRLKVDMKRNARDNGKKSSSAALAVKAESRSQAQEYIEKHLISEKMSGCMRDLLHAKPDDPIEFMCSYLRGMSSKTAHTPAAGPSAALHMSSLTCGKCGASLKADGTPVVQEQGSALQERVWPVLPTDAVDPVQRATREQRDSDVEVDAAPFAQAQQISLAAQLPIDPELYEREALRENTLQLLVASNQDGRLNQALDKERADADKEIVCETLDQASKADSPLQSEEVRYVLHRFFAQRGWSILGLEPGTTAQNSSSGDDSLQPLQEWLPTFLQNFLEQLDDGRGIGPRELAILVATLEDHIQQDGRLLTALQEQHQNTHSAAGEQQDSTVNLDRSAAVKATQQLCASLYNHVLESGTSDKPSCERASEEAASNNSNRALSQQASSSAELHLALKQRCSAVLASSTLDGSLVVALKDGSYSSAAEMTEERLPGAGVERPRVQVLKQRAKQGLTEGLKNGVLEGSLDKVNFQGDVAPDKKAASASASGAVNMTDLVNSKQATLTSLCERTAQNLALAAVDGSLVQALRNVHVAEDPSKCEPATVQSLIESLKGSTLQEITECLSGVHPGELAKLKKYSGVQPLVESLQGGTLDAVTECLSGLPPGELKKLEKAAGVQPLLKSLGGAKLDAVTDCLSGVPPWELKKLQTTAGVDLLTKSLKGSTLDAVTECLSGVPPVEVKKLEVTEGVGNLIKSLKGATLDAVTECLSGVPPGELKKLDVIAGFDPLIKSLTGATLDAVTECLSGLPPGELTKLEMAAGVDPLIQRLNGATLDAVTECLAGLPPGELKKLEIVAGVEALIKSLQGATLDAVTECLSGLPLGELKKLEELAG